MHVLEIQHDELHFGQIQRLNASTTCSSSLFAVPKKIKPCSSRIYSQSPFLLNKRVAKRERSDRAAEARSRQRVLDDLDAAIIDHE